MRDTPSCRACCVAAVITCAVLPAANGCRSRAQQDLYQQKLIKEVRILEDKLYEADYQNRVLADKLKRARIEAREVPIHSAKPARRPDDGLKHFPEPTPDSGTAPMDEDDPDEIGLGDLLPPVFDEGEPIEPDVINGSDPAKPKPATDGLPVPLTDPIAPTGTDRFPAPSFPEPKGPTSPSEAPIQEGVTPLPDHADSLLEPAPGGPVPPGKKDTELPPVLPGDNLPPLNGDSDDIKPPGQIQLPDSAKANDRIPEALRVHPTLSGANRVDGKIEDMLVVVNVVNNLGKTIDLEDFLVDGELSVVILDPEREPSEARLGRWNFDRELVLELVRQQPSSGFHVSLPWTGDEPRGKEVIIHVRLRAEDDEMRCEAKLNLEKQPGVAGWMPRVESLR